MRRNPLLVIATMLAVLVSSFLVFTTLSARAIVENNTSRWQNGVHVVIFLDDRVTSTAHQQLQETLESYSEVRMVEYFSKSEATEEFKTLFQDQPELVQEVYQNQLWTLFDENYRAMRNPEKYKDPDESDKPYHKRSREARMRDPERGINSPAFKKFMADRGMSV